MKNLFKSVKLAAAMLVGFAVTSCGGGGGGSSSSAAGGASLLLVPAGKTQSIIQNVVVDLEDGKKITFSFTFLAGTSSPYEGVAQAQVKDEGLVENNAEYQLTGTWNARPASNPGFIHISELSLENSDEGRYVAASNIRLKLNSYSDSQRDGVFDQAVINVEKGSSVGSVSLNGVSFSMTCN